MSKFFLEYSNVAGIYGLACFGSEFIVAGGEHLSFLSLRGYLSEFSVALAMLPLRDSNGFIVDAQYVLRDSGLGWVGLGYRFCKHLLGRVHTLRKFKMFYRRQMYDFSTLSYFS